MQTSQAHILIVEDEPSIADNIVFALQLDGFSSQHRLLAAEALSYLQQHPTDLAIIDVGLPDFNGFELCRKIRAFSDIPIIFLTARADEVDRILGLELGADDYVTKPFSPRELSTRVKTILRRAQPRLAKTPLPATLRVDHDKAAVFYQQQRLDLTRIEYLILSQLISHPERVFSREQLMQAAWENPQHSLERAVDTHIKSLRAKFKQVAPDLNPIKTHRGLGYSLELPR